MKTTHFIQSHNGVSERMVGFMAHLRDNGLAAGSDEFRYSMKALQFVDCLSSDEVRLACKAVCARNAVNYDQFDELFNAYWRNGGREKFSIQKQVQQNGPASRNPFSRILDESQAGVAADTTDDAGEPDEADNREDSLDGLQHEGDGKLTGSRIRNIEKVDLREMMTPDALARAQSVAHTLANAMRDKRSRRRRSANRGNALNMRRTIRDSISTGGDPVKLHKQRRPDRPVNIVALLDVSGSMMVYSRVFLAFLKGLVSHDQRTDAYLFHTGLVRVRDVMRDSDTLRAINRLSLMAQGFGGGTRIGENLRRFNQQYAAKTVNCRSVVIVFSDGYDTDPPELLARSLERLKKRGCRIIWLNPLKGWSDYQPVAQGMAAALPHLDLFAAANTLESLAALESHLVRL